MLVLLLAHRKNIPAAEIYMKTGTAKNTKYIPVHILHEMLSPAVTEGLIAFHAMTGCDTTSYFYRKGKKTALQVFQHQPNLLRNIGKTEGSAQSETYVDAEKFVCSLYGLPELGLVDSVRASLFRQGKTVDCLPPTSDALKHHVDRCHY